MRDQLLLELVAVLHVRSAQLQEEIRQCLLSSLVPRMSNTSSGGNPWPNNLTRPVSLPPVPTANELHRRSSATQPRHPQAGEIGSLLPSLTELTDQTRLVMGTQRRAIDTAASR
jgi:hypothetical protein